MRLHERLFLYLVPLVILPLAALGILLLYVVQQPEQPLHWLGESLEYSVAVFFVSIALASIVMIRSVARSIAAPLQNARMHIQRIARGERHTPILAGEAEGELKALAIDLEKLRSELVTHESQLQQQSSDVAKGEMATQMAHDMRSPISVVLAVMRPIRTASATPAHAELCDSVETAAQKLNTMADDLLEVARAKRITALQTDLAALVRSAVRQVERTLEDRDVTLQYAGAESCIAEVDRDKLDRVLTNLTQNAVQAIPAERSGEVCVEMVDEVTRVAIHVRDNGSGIAPAHQARMFEKFFTTKGKHGNGIGLAYCKDVIEAHGGVLTVKSEIGVGTCFTMRLPKQVADAANPIEQKSAAPLRVVSV